MSERDVDLNREALVKAVKAVGRKSIIFGGFILLVTITVGIIGGSSAASGNGTPGWDSVFFMYGGFESLAFIVPIAICLYISASLTCGTIAFIYFRFIKR